MPTPTHHIYAEQAFKYMETVVAMDATSLHTAAAYINNLLLARGLLRNGTPVEFTQLVRKQSESKVVLGHVINLVHDMILRRDREQAHQEEFASSMHSLRSEAQQSTTTIDRLTTQNKDLQRQLALAQAQTRTAQSTLHTVEASVRSLREEMWRTKTMLVQVRKQCENDVRKRDLQIQRLKTHLSAQQRGTGNKATIVGPSITINPGGGGRAGKTASLSVSEGEAPNLEDPDYNLKQETTDFLTELSQSLSDENDSLLGLVRGTVMTLKELQGIQQQSHGQSAHDQIQNQEDSMVQVVPTSCGELARELEAVLRSLRDLLTNPSFAPIEEVQLREEEILRLRDGWERMESRWREAVKMMEGWRKRMLSGGDTVNLQELKIGLGLGNGLESLGAAGANANGPLLDDTDGKDGHDQSFDKQELSPEDIALPSDEDDSIPDRDPGVDLLVARNTKSSSPLKELNGNIPPLVATRKVSLKAARNASSKIPQKQDTSTRFNSAQARVARSAAEAGPVNSTERSNKRTKRSSLNGHIPLPEVQLTVSQKLKLAEEEARVAASSSPLILDSSPEERKRKGRGGATATAANGSPVKRTRIMGRPRRRKSTLTPEELDALLVSTLPDAM